MATVFSRPISTRRARYALLALPLVFAACGKVGAPTNADIQHVVHSYMMAANQRASDRSLGLFDGPYDPAHVKITNSDCTARDNGVYHCTVTSMTNTGNHTADLNLKKVNGDWTIVEN